MISIQGNRVLFGWSKTHTQAVGSTTVVIIVFTVVRVGGFWHHRVHLKPDGRYFERDRDPMFVVVVRVLFWVVVRLGGLLMGRRVLRRRHNVTVCMRFAIAALQHRLRRDFSTGLRVVVVAADFMSTSGGSGGGRVSRFHFGALHHEFGAQAGVGRRYNGLFQDQLPLPSRRSGHRQGVTDVLVRIHDILG
jgi:hypothetical protein